MDKHTAQSLDRWLTTPPEDQWNGPATNDEIAEDYAYDEKRSGKIADILDTFGNRGTMTEDEARMALDEIVKNAVLFGIEQGMQDERERQHEEQAEYEQAEWERLHPEP